MSFSVDISKFAKKANASLEETSRTIKTNLFSGVIQLTRVADPDTWKNPVKGYIGGRLKGNWQTSTGSPVMTVIDRIDPEGDAAIAQVKATVRGDTVDYMTNNLPYAEVLEEQDGMIARNMARIKRTVKESIK